MPAPGAAATRAEAPAPATALSTRRQLLLGTGALGALAAVGAGSVAGRRLSSGPVDPRTEISLWSQTVAYDATGSRTLVSGDAAPLELDPDSRWAAELAASSPVRERAAAFRDGTEQWRARLDERLQCGTTGDSPATTAQLGSLAATALLDLWVLSDALPAPVAGWSAPWRYVWPRDAAFGAVALSRIGHREQAISVLEHLGTLQGRDGWFEARYVPGTDRAPDRRPRQFDGTGLLLWACDEVVQDLEGPAATGALERLSPLITRSLSALHGSTSAGTCLPPVSPDYWEVRERSVTLGIMAATLAGLRAGARLTGSLEARRAAEAFALLLEGTFGATGYQRYRSGGGADSALALLAATGGADLATAERLLPLRGSLARPGGGVAPGAAWREDGVSWTPSTSLLGLALARAGETGAALEVLSWLAEHRTEAGSLPEKVLFDGRPAEVAPLAWTAANVLLTLDTLARG